MQHAGRVRTVPNLCSVPVCASAVHHPSFSEFIPVLVLLSMVLTLIHTCHCWCAVQLDVAVNFGLLSLLVWKYVYLLTGTGPADAFNLRQFGIRVEYVVPAAFAGESSSYS
jgi:hypothetical protein